MAATVSSTSADVIAELAAGAEETQALVETMDAGVRVVADTATQCAAAAEQSARLAADISATASGAGPFCQALYERVASLRALLTTAAVDVYRQIDWVTVAVEDSARSAELINGLESLSGEVSGFVETVVGIADQTNLVAFNAAIEAARAGKQGRGFAVVADEVRSLAETSGTAAEQIMDLVAGILADVRSVAADVTAIAEDGSAEMERARQIGDDLTRIHAEMESVLTAARDTKDCAAATVVAAGDMRQACGALSDSAARAAAAAEEAVAAVSEQNAAAASIATAAVSLSQVDDEARLAREVSDLGAVLGQSAASSQQIVAAIGDIAASAEQLSASARETLKGTKQAEAAATRAVGLVTQGSAVAGSVRELLSTTSANVGGLVQSIAGSAEHNMAAVGNIERLRARARQIDKIVDTIVGLTTQTNLLALHGAIEAARAGKLGRGFAVVASDVRSLALESAEAVDKIKTVVRDMQDQIVRVARDVEEAGRAARRQAREAQRSTQSLSTAQSELEQIYKDMSMVVGLAGADVERAKQVVAAMGDVASASAKMAAAAEEAGRAAGEITGGMRDLARSSTQIMTQHAEDGDSTCAQ